MYRSVDEVFDQNIMIFSQLKELVNAHLELKKGIALIGEYRQIQEADNSGLTKVKAQLRSNVIQRILQVSAALGAYAITVNDMELNSKSDYVYSDLNRASDPVVFDIGVLLGGLATPLKGELARYFVGETELKELEHLLAEFKLEMPRRRLATSVSKVSTANIRNLFRSQDQLLKERVDVLLLPFRYSLPDFYHTYQHARAIVDYTGRQKQH